MQIPLNSLSLRGTSSHYTDSGVAGVDSGACSRVGTGAWTCMGAACGVVAVAACGETGPSEACKSTGGARCGAAGKACSQLSVDEFRSLTDSCRIRKVVRRVFTHIQEDRSLVVLMVAVVAQNTFASEAYRQEGFHP